MKLILAIILVCILIGCSTTKRVSDGEYLLVRNEVKIDKSANRTERIKATDLEKYIRQSPNRKFLGLNFYLGVYNMANPESNSWVNRKLRSIGEPPVILDTTLVYRSEVNLSNYIALQGYLVNDVTCKIDTAKKKAKVTYIINQRTPYRIRTLKREYIDGSVSKILSSDTVNSLIKEGDVMNFTVLDKERFRIVNQLKDLGYYNFALNNIYYVADTTVAPFKADVRMVVNKSQVGVDANGEPIMENSSVYRLRNIYVNTDFNPMASTTDSLYMSGFDTVTYRGLNIIYRGKPLVRERVIKRNIHLNPNTIYSSSKVNQTYNSLMRLGYYKNASIHFSTHDSSSDNQVTYVGDSDVQQKGESTSEKLLDVHIWATPAMRQSYKVEVEGSATSSYWSLSSTIGYQNRNLFRGVELFDISVKGGYEFSRIQGRKPAFEIGSTTSFSFPRLLVPFKIGRHRAVYNGHTKIELSINDLKRPYYHRTLFSASWGYNWSLSEKHSIVLRPIDLSLVKMGYVNQDFLESLQNRYLVNSYTDQVIAGLSGAYLYTSKRDSHTNPLTTTVRVNWETAGNTIYGLSSLFGSKQPGNDYYEIFGIRYAQYVRLDASFAVRIPTGVRTTLAYRLLAGIGSTYGNSLHTSMPFDRLYFAGGSNSMRGWQPRTLGPGGVPYPEDALYPSQMGNMKLETNLEWRFPVWGVFRGAIFSDLGNVWIVGNKSQNPPESIFSVKDFYKQLALNSGLGLRLDMGIFLFRLDLGIQIHDPSKPSGKRWIQSLTSRQCTLSFGAGLPF